MLVLVTTIFPGGEAPQAAALVAGAVEQHQAAVYRHVDRSGEVQTAAVGGHRPVTLPRRAMPESLVESASASMPAARVVAEAGDRHGFGGQSAAGVDDRAVVTSRSSTLSEAPDRSSRARSSPAALTVERS